MSRVRVDDSNKVVRRLIHSNDSDRKVPNEVVYSGPVHQSQGQQKVRHATSPFQRDLHLDHGSLIPTRSHDIIHQIRVALVAGDFVRAIRNAGLGNAQADEFTKAYQTGLSMIP